MRLLYCLQDPASELRFGFKVIKEPQNNLNILFNISRLIENKSKTKISKVEDKWILSKLNSLIKNATKEIGEMRYFTATRLLQDFWLNDLSRRYIKFVRDRIANEDKSCLYVLKEVYAVLIKICSPIIPFLTEAVWQDLRKKKIVREESVHLCSWPKADVKKINKKLEGEFENVFGIIEKGLYERETAKIGLKWPLKSANISAKFDISNDIKELIKSQLNVKEVYFDKVPKLDSLGITLDVKLTPELEAEGYARELSRKVQDFRKKIGLQKKDSVELIIITDGDFKKILETQKSFIKERTNSKKLEIEIKNILDTIHLKEKFKNKISFNIRDKRGIIIIITSG